MKSSITLIIISLFIGSAWFGWSCRTVDKTPPSTQTAQYQEPYRPQFHFSPDSMWMNDPNGMVYYAGEYHLFYQFYPDSNVWGPMHWGHAISTDLVHWEHLPIALYPDSLGYIFSGSAVVDHNNTSGLGKNGHPPLVAIFTHHDPIGAEAQNGQFQYQSIAYSNDKGRTWTKYAGNPVIPNPGNQPDFRDPKVIWDEDSEQWIMVFAVKDYSTFWGSKDLIHWQHLSDFGREYGSHGGVWECPDFFPLQVEETGETKWVLLQSIGSGGPNGGSGTQYFVGDFDGTQFVLDPKFEPLVKNQQPVWLDCGRDNYAGVTWSDIPSTDGRRLFIGWMSNWDYAQVVPTTAWRSASTLPRKLSLHFQDHTYQLRSFPVQELRKIRQQHIPLEPTTIDSVLDLHTHFGEGPVLAELNLLFDLSQSQADTFGIELASPAGDSYILGYVSGGNHFISNRTRAGSNQFSDKFAAKVHVAPRLKDSNELRLTLYLDLSSAELFADQGQVVMTDIFFPKEDFNQLRIYADGGAAKLSSGELHILNSIW